MSERNYLKPALIGGAALGVASAIPLLNCLNLFCCALAIGGGYLAAHLYYKDAPPVASPPYGEGALLGLLTGAIGAVVTVIIGIPFNLLFSSMGMGGDPEQLEQILGGTEIPPQLKEMLVSMSSGGLNLGMILMSLVMYLFAFGLFAMVGALIGVAVYGKKKPPATGYAPPPA